MKLKELKEKLEGVFDLGDPEDCQKVIEMLLCDLDGANERGEKSEPKLKMLAYLVSKERPDARGEAKKILSGVSNGAKPRMWDMLMGMVHEIGRAESLDDEQLVDEISEEIWGEFYMDSRESAILEELIRRFREKGNVKDAICDKVS